MSISYFVVIDSREFGEKANGIFKKLIIDYLLFMSKNKLFYKAVSCVTGTRSKPARNPGATEGLGKRIRVPEYLTSSSSDGFELVETG